MPDAVNGRMAQYRARLRAQGMRLLQIWVPDTSAPGFDEECHRESAALAASQYAEQDQAFVDSVSQFPDEMDDE